MHFNDALYIVNGFRSTQENNATFNHLEEVAAILCIFLNTLS